jgi:aubergine
LFFLDNVDQFLINVTKNSKSRRFSQDVAAAQLVGQIVLTRYNNRTYRVDNIDWNKTPKSLFTKRDGTQVSYEQYYLTAYNIRIRDASQPLLVTYGKRTTTSTSTSSTDSVIYLIPELCTMTGM